MVDGTFGGQTLTVGSVLAQNDMLGASYETIIYLTNIVDACGQFDSQLANIDTDIQDLALDMVTSVPLAPGVFDIAAFPRLVGASFFSEPPNPTCYNQEDAATGTITIVSVTSSQITGNFDVTLYPVDADGALETTGADHVTGTFSAPICAVAPDTDADVEISDGGPGITVCN